MFTTSSRPHVVSFVAAGLSLLLGFGAGTATAAGPEEVFEEAANRGQLAPGSFEMLQVTESTCLLKSQRRQLLCVTHDVASDKSERWEALVVGPKGVEHSGRVLVLSASAAAEGDDPAPDVKGCASVNKAVKKETWDRDVEIVATYSVANGMVRFSTELAPALADGRTIAVAPDGITLSDGSVFDVAPLPGTDTTSVQVYALPGTSALVALVEDAVTAKEGGTVKTRIVMARAGAAGAPATPAKTADAVGSGGCPAGVWCPPNQGVVAPFLDRFCREDFGDDAVAEVKTAAAEGRLVADDLSLLFNAYGALYGYEFKKLSEYNVYFYGRGAPAAVATKRPWLPASCRDAFEHFTTANAPASLRKARDQLKKVWTQYK